MEEDEWETEEALFPEPYPDSYCYLGHYEEGHEHLPACSNNCYMCSVEEESWT